MLLTVLVCFCLGIRLPCFAAENPAAGDYKPDVPVYIDAYAGMPSFFEDRLPHTINNALKVYPKPGPGATPYDLVIHQLQVFIYLYNDYLAISMMNLNDGGITFDVVVPKYDARFKITMGEYFWKNGQVIFRHGITETVISPAEFDKLKFAWANHIVESAYHLTFEKFKDLRQRQMNVYEKVLRENNLLSEEETVKDILAKNKDLAADMMFVAPEFKLEDFLPKQVFIRPMRSEGGMIMGLCMLETGIVVYDPSSLVFDYLQYSDVALHEMVHKNSYLQTLIGGTYYDLEVQTSMTERYSAGWSYLFHPYMRGLNKTGKILFSLDDTRARREILEDKGGFNTISFNAEAVNYYLPKAAEVKEAMSEFLMNRFLPEFYLHKLFWACVGDELVDKKGAFMVALVHDFAFSYLGGPVETMKQLQENEPIILEVYEKAREKSEKEKAKNENNDQRAFYGRISETAETVERLLPLLRTYAAVMGWKYNSTEELLKLFYNGLELGLVSPPQILSYDVFRGRDIFPDFTFSSDQLSAISRFIEEVSHENH